MNKVAVYGTLKKGYSNHRLLKRQKFIGQGLLSKDFSLIISGLPFVIKEKGPTEIKCEIYEVSKRCMTNLDYLEGHPDLYKRELTPVKTEDGEEHECWVYFYTDDQMKDIDDKYKWDTFEW